jgi:ATPase subunit of ABC transporter with duplicated ATPase domains
MTAFLTLDSISLATPDGRPLFDRLTLALGRERTGIVGRNGCGKSTLLRAIAGEIEPASGSVQRAGSIGVLAQSADDSLTVAEALGVAHDLARLRRLGSGDGSLDDATNADWTLQTRLDAALVETGLPALPPDRRLASLSGGERTRVALARLLIETPDVLLLDEPTNNLDADGREAVAQLLERWRGGVVVASHDRALLERVDRIVELTSVGITVFGGAWSAFAEARDAARRRAEADLDRASDALRNTRRAVQKAREKKARRDKAGRAWRAKGIEDKMFMDAEKQRAENSGSREGHLADRLIDGRTEALEEARARRSADTALDRSAEDRSARQPRTPGFQGRGDDSRRPASVWSAVVRSPRPPAHRHQWRQRIRQDDSAPPDHGTPRAHRRRYKPPDRSHRGARSACRPARSASQHPRQSAPPQSRFVRQ